ncbi:MAG: type III pantothenate kinase [Lachnospiraceae bacterium]|nr:type III pantothenate kinase [Lachnospiraceae bacterium]
MILALDVGNTNIVVGMVEDEKVVCSCRLGTDLKKTQDEYAIHLKMLLDVYKEFVNNVEGAIISSVVPNITATLQGAVEIITGKKPLVVGAGIKTGLNIVVDNPTTLGSDLVVDAVAATEQYEGPIIVIDMGTATTCSVIDSKHNYIGGIIIPGLKISQDALSERASQLPYISYDAPKKVVGKNTVDCMKSGAIFGTAAMIDGLIDRIEEEIGEKTTVLATGGLARVFVDHCKHNIIFDDELLLKGLWYIYQKNQK